MQQGFAGDIRITNWEKAFEDGEMVGVPVAKSGPLVDCILVDPRTLETGSDGIIINALIPLVLIPQPTVIIGKPFAFKVKVDTVDDAKDEDGQPVATKQVRFELHYLPDDKLQKIQEIVSQSVPEQVDQHGRTAAPPKQETH